MTPAIDLDLRITVEHAPGPRGLAIVLPGFLDSAHYPATAALGDTMLAAGFTSIRFDLRGSWGNGGTPHEYRTSGHVQDLHCIIDHAGEAAAARVVIVGYCYGAFLAALAADADARVTDVVALVPTRCFIWPEDYDADRDTWRLDREREFLRADPVTGVNTAVRVPHTAVEDARRHDLPAALGRLRSRILFVAGAWDSVISPTDVLRLHDGCGSPDKELVVLPIEHDYRHNPAQIDLVDRTIFDWLG